MAYRWMVIMVAATALALPPAAGLAQGHGRPRSEAYVKPLINSTIPELVRRFGEPIEAYPMTETGGKLYIFETPQHEYCIVETAIGGNIVDAVVKHADH
jgi:hypothetical protein